MVETEKDMYLAIANFLREKKEVSEVLIDKVTFSKIKNWRVDVVGFKEGKIFAVEAKKDFNIDSVFSALKQAEFYKEFSPEIYLCFPKDEYERKENSELKEFVEERCKNEGFGILLYNSSSKNVEPRIEPDIKKSKQNINFETYYHVLSQFIGNISVEEKAELIIKIGLLVWEKWYNNIKQKWEKIKKEICTDLHLNRDLALDILIFEHLIWPMETTIRDPKARSDEIPSIKDSIVQDAKNKRVTPWYIIYTNFPSGFKEIKRDGTKDFLRKLWEFAGRLKSSNFSVVQYYKQNGLEKLWAAIKEVKGFGDQTAELFIIELRRFLGFPLSKTLAGEEYVTRVARISDMLKLLGLTYQSLEKAAKKYNLALEDIAPLIDAGSFLLTQNSKEFTKEHKLTIQHYKNTEKYLQ